MCLLTQSKQWDVVGSFPYILEQLIDHINLLLRL